MAENHKSRAVNYSRNMTVALVYQVLNILFNFIVRWVFVQTLDVEYLGLNGLFSNILAILSLSELGVGTAIIYSLYKPIKEDDKEKIKALMALYKKIYISVGLFMMFAGAIIAPFIELFIKDVPDISGIRLIFWLFVFQSAITYFFSYKIQFLYAVQKNYIIQLFDMACSIVQLFLQIIILILFKSYFLYLVISIICPFVKNVLATSYVNKLYPFLREKASKIQKEDLDVIKKNVFSIFLYRVATQISNTIDTLLISKFMGIIEVAIYYNYHWILSFSDKLFISVIGTITPSLGNFMVSSEQEKKNRLFSTMQMMYYWISSYLAVGLTVLFNPLIELWLGKEFLFPQYIVVALVVSTTLTNFQRPCSLVRDSNGLFWYGRFRPVASAIINVIASIVFAKLFGTVGVILGTILSKILTFVWYDPYVVFKYALKSSLKKYFYRYFFQWGLLILLTLICYVLFYFIPFNGLIKFILGVVLVTFIVNGTFLMIYFKTDDFMYIRTMIKNVIRGRKR